MLKFKKIFSNPISVIGMVHLKALPGTPNFQGSFSDIVNSALKDVHILIENKVDGILVENMHDLPYVKGPKLGPEITASFARICTEIRLIAKNIPCGIQVLAAGNLQALAIAKACSFNFIRVEGFVFGHMADEGYIDACAGELLRYQKNIKADDILILTDIKKKHSSHAITKDVTLSETAKAAEFFKSDGLIITGKETGDSVNIDDLKDLKLTTTLPIIIGSGVTANNYKHYLSANAFIIGSYFKENGKWHSDVSEERVKNFMKEISRQ